MLMSDWSSDVCSSDLLNRSLPMGDVVTREKRSSMMAGIRGKNTRPETLIRKGLHKLGFRYRLHENKLPGKPDLVLPKYNAVILIHGCFWHKIGRASGREKVCHNVESPVVADQI